jgi:hypothetical protein
MSYRGPGFLVVEWSLFVSLPVSPVELTELRGGGRGAGEKVWSYKIIQYYLFMLQSLLTLLKNVLLILKSLYSHMPYNFLFVVSIRYR